MIWCFSPVMGHGVEWAEVILLVCQANVMTGERNRFAEGVGIRDPTIVFKL